MSQLEYGLKTGLVKFPQVGSGWNLYIHDHNKNPITKELLEDLETDAPEGFGIHALREIFKALNCEKLFIKEYFKEYFGDENRL